MDRFARLALVVVILATGCQPTQLGDQRFAGVAATEFLQLLRDRRAEDAWAVLTPATRHATYEDVFERFAADVADADLDGLRWEVGPVIDHDISWGVHVEMDPEGIPEFLINGSIASYWDEQGLVLLVQVTGPDSYLIAGPGLDTRLQP